MRQNPVENLFRKPTEIFTAITAICCALILIKLPSRYIMSSEWTHINCTLFVSIGLYRFSQAIKLLTFQKRLEKLPVFKLGTKQIPISKKYFYLGKGFEWKASHTQRLHQIKQIANERFTGKSKFYQAVRTFCQNHEGMFYAKFLSSNTIFNPFRPQPELGGKAYLHGLGNEDKNIRMLQAHRTKHSMYFGAPGLGKTRKADIAINQDIRNHEAVIILDPKGDNDLLKGIYNSCSAANRLDDFKIVHIGYPEISAKYNPLKNYDDITELPTRITAAIEAGGDGAQFKDFAWKYTNLVCRALSALSISITYEAISLYITRLDAIIELYADKFMPTIDSYYKIGVASIKDEHDNKVDKNGNKPPPMDRAKAVIKYLKTFILERMSQNKVSDIKLLVDLYKAATQDPEYIDKITQCLGPVLSKITDGRAAQIFNGASGEEVDLFDVIKNKKVLYIGLDSLSNAEVASAVGKAILSDLVSIAGKIYKTPEDSKDIILNLHVDEISEVITESFVRILNKARGAGFRVTAYGQTLHDIAVALGNVMMAKQALGNFSTLGMMRVENEETAEVLVKSLPMVEVVTHTQVSMVTDTPHGENGTYFNTNNEDRVQTKSEPMLTVSDICALPVGQAFIKMDGNRLFKVRFPLSKKDGDCPSNIQTMIKLVNKISDKPSIPEVKTFKNIDPVQPTRVESPIEEVNSEAHTMPVENPAEIEEEATLPSKQNEKVSDNDLSSEASSDLAAFKEWLAKRIESGNKRFHPDGQNLIFATEEHAETNQVFIKDEIFIKYQLRSSVDVEAIKQELQNTEDRKSVTYRNGDDEFTLYQISMPQSFDVANPIIIEE